MSSIDSENNTRIYDREDEGLKVERELRRLVWREIGQRFYIRWIAVGSGVAVMLLMAYVLFHHLFLQALLPQHSGFSWVLVVAPVTSVTVVTVALLVAGFRRFEDKDLSKAGNSIATGVDWLEGG